jgi:geranylgeranyl diphosphate synthase type I
MRAAGENEGPAKQLYDWVLYQLGWMTADGQWLENRQAKGLRPRLCLLACSAVRGQMSAAVPAATAIELTHEFSLVHDDIEDGDRIRRGRPAAWDLIGVAQGINLGDALFSLARRELGASPVSPEVLARMHERYDGACIQLAEGQFLDLCFESRDDVTVDDYIGMVARKTGALLGAAAAIGAEAGGADPTVGDAFGRFGLEVGIAFQVADDILGIWGNEADTGKPVGHDLLRGKKSLPVLLGRGSELEKESAAVRATGGLTAASELASRMEDAGIREASLRYAHKHVGLALDALSGLSLDEEAALALENLARRAAQRIR